MARFRSFADIYTEVLCKLSKKYNISMLELAERLDKAGIEKKLKDEYNNTLIMKEKHYIEMIEQSFQTYDNNTRLMIIIE